MTQDATLAVCSARRGNGAASDARHALVADGRTYAPPESREQHGRSSPAELLLVRDFAGIKPLFWASLPGRRVAFASEYKALLALPDLDCSPDRDALQRVQHTKFLPMSGATLVKSVRSVPPGAALAVDFQGRTRVIARASPPPLEIRDDTEDALQRRIAATFSASIARRLAGAGRVGVALSGDDDPEVRTAAAVSERLGAEHHVVAVPARRIVELLPEVIWHLEAPIARSETVQFYEIGRAAAARGVDTLMMGVAADLLYAGMPNYKLLRLYERLPLPPLRRALHEFQSLTQTGYSPRSLAGRCLRRAYFRGMLPEAPRVLGAAWQPPLTPLPTLGPEFLNAYLHWDLQEDTAQWTPKIERTLAAWGVMPASPFLDRESIRTAFTIPSRFKIHGWREKYILRRALRSCVDADMTEFRKFPMRMHYDGEFADALDALVAQYLSPARVAARGLFDPASLAAIRNYRRGGRYSAEGAMRAWTAVGTEMWAEQFLDRRGEPEPRRSTARWPASSRH